MTHFLKSDHIRRLFKEGFWVVLGQGMAVCGSLLGVRLLTEIMDPTAYGELALGMTAAILVNQTVLGPLSNGTTRFYAPAVEQGDLGGYLKAVRRLVGLATGAVALLVVLVVLALLMARQARWITIAVAALVFAILSGYNLVLNGIQNAARQRSIVALHQGMESWARFLMAAGLLLVLGATSTMAMVGYAIAAILVLGSQYLFFRKIIHAPRVSVNGHKHWQRQMWQYSWPFVAWGVFSWAQQASDRWALQLFGTTEEVGHYAVLFQLGYYPMSMVTTMAMQFLAPVFYERAGDASDGARNASVSTLSWRLTTWTLVTAGAVFVASFLFHAQIFSIFVAKDYASVSFLLPWMLLAGGVFAAGQTIALNLMSQMKTHALMVVKIATGVTGVVLNFAGAYWYGITGIVAGMVLCSVLYFLWTVVLSKETKKNQLNEGGNSR